MGSNPTLSATSLYKSTTYRNIPALPPILPTFEIVLLGWGGSWRNGLRVPLPGGHPPFSSDGTHAPPLHTGLLVRWASGHAALLIQPLRRMVTRAFGRRLCLQ